MPQEVCGQQLQSLWRDRAAVMTATTSMDQQPSVRWTEFPTRIWFCVCVRVRCACVYLHGMVKGNVRNELR